MDLEKRVVLPFVGRPSKLPLLPSRQTRPGLPLSYDPIPICHAGELVKEHRFLTLAEIVQAVAARECGVGISFNVPEGKKRVLVRLGPGLNSHDQSH